MLAEHVVSTDLDGFNMQKKTENNNRLDGSCWFLLALVKQKHPAISNPSFFLGVRPERRTFHQVPRGGVSRDVGWAEVERFRGGDGVCSVRVC